MKNRHDIGACANLFEPGDGQFRLAQFDLVQSVPQRADDPFHVCGKRRVLGLDIDTLQGNIESQDDESVHRRETEKLKHTVWPFNQSEIR